MRMLVLAIALLAAPWEAMAGPVGEADDAAIRTVVEAQLQAFQNDDASAAFAKASPTIQQLFRTPEGFMAMVRHGYASVYRPQMVELLDIVTFRGQPTLRVYVVGPDGRAAIANYLMQQQPDGSWRINGCVMEELPEVAA